MRFAAAILGIFVILVVMTSAAVYSGAYNVAASKPANPVIAWLLHAVMVNSVEWHARRARPPADDAPGRLGFGHYREHCVGCHGGPGLPPSDLARGLNPRAPDLAGAAGRWSPAQLFWIVKNGIEMTGMPAWGPSHTDQELWQIVAFLRDLPTLSAEQYQAMDRQHAHSHAHSHAEPGE